jgi:hypothetical protein
MWQVHALCVCRRGVAVFTPPISSFRRKSSGTLPDALDQHQQSHNGIAINQSTQKASRPCYQVTSKNKAYHIDPSEVEVGEEADGFCELRVTVKYACVILRITHTLQGTN